MPFDKPSCDRILTSRDLEKVIDEYVHECCVSESPPRTEELAEALGIPLRTFFRLTRRLLGATPAEHIRRARRRRAAALLETTMNTTEEVARQAGYGTRRSLFRAFRRELNCSPGSLRAPRHRADEVAPNEGDADVP